MKLSRTFLTGVLLSCIIIAATAQGQNTYTLNALNSFGTRGDGSIQPGDSIGTNPQSGNAIAISAPFTSPTAYGVQPGDASISTNGFNMRGIGFDPVSSNIVFVDTHTGSAGSATMATNAAIYILDHNSGQIIGALNTNGMIGGSYTHVVACVADDGAVYICNQTTASTTTGFKIYRWSTADINNLNFTNAPVVSYSNTLSPSDRLGQTMDVRGAGTNTQLIVGSSSANGTGTNVYLFTTADGINFTPHRLFFPGITTAVFNDGIAFGPGNTFFAKQVGQPFLFLAFDPVAFTGSVIASYSASSLAGTDPLLNLAGITVDNNTHLMGAVEEIGGTATGGRGKVWLFDISNISNQAPAILTSRTYIPNFTKATATMGYLHFGAGNLYANVVNNGFLASTVTSTAMSAPSFTLPADFPGGQPKVTDLPATTRAAAGTNVHFEVFATPDVTNYQWYTNGIAIPGATTYFLNVANITTNMNGWVFQVVASNAVASTPSTASTLVVVSAGSFFHPVLLWATNANTTALTDPTNYITSNGGASTPNERTIAYSALSNQLIIVRGPAAFSSLKIFAVNANTGQTQYLLKTNGIVSSQTLQLCGAGIADDGAFYAASVSASDNSFKVYRWADTGSNTLPVCIFGTNSSANQANPVVDVTSQITRFGDALAVHGSGANTEIAVDSQNNTTYAGILRPVNDGTMTNWTQTGYVLQNISGSYGFQAYGTGIGRSIQFGPNENGPFGSTPTFWQKRYNVSGAPLAGMGYNVGGGLAVLDDTTTSLPLYTNGLVGLNFTLNLAAAISFSGTIANDLSVADQLNLFDLTDPTQPIYLSSVNLPGGNAGGHKGNGNAVAQILFGFNPSNGSNYIFSLEGNNGVAAYLLAGGVTPAPKMLAQPQNIRLLQGATASMNVQIDQSATIAWYQGTNPPVNTGVSGNTFNIANAQSSNAGPYFVIATNINGSVTSSVANVTVLSASNNYTLTQIWGAGGGNANFPYLTANGGANTPNERSFGYNAINRHLIIASCPVLTHNFKMSVVDANSGTLLYTMNTGNVLLEGASEVSGSNPLDLDAVAVGDDGAVYACCLTPNASGGAANDTNKMLHVYRWADDGSNTPCALIFQGDPSGQPAGIDERWGDNLEARGSGTNTQLVLNTQDGVYGAILAPTDSTLATFAPYWFFDSGGAGSIGRSLQFGSNNAVFEKRKGAITVESSFNTNNQTSAQLLSVASTGTLGGVYIDTVHNLAAGVDFIGSATAPLKPDAVALYDISDPTTPLLLAEKNFASNQVANANFICQTQIAGLRVYSLDANNGMQAFFINPPASGMTLNIAPSGTNVNLSWGSSIAILQSSLSLDPSAWNDLTVAGQTNSTQPANGGATFYRLIVKR